MEIAKISVIMPVYKVPYTLLRMAIESVLEQTYRNLELLLIDDGSPDGCGEICDSYSESDERVTTIHVENGGASRARNIGLTKATGEFIAFVDSDDCISACMLEKMLEQYNQSDADIVACGCNHVKGSVVDEDDVSDFGIIKLNKTDAIEALCYMNQPFEGFELTSVWGYIYPRTIVEDIFFDESLRIGEDFVFNFKVMQKIDKLLCVSAPYYSYLIRESSIMRSSFDKRILTTVPYLENILEEKNYIVYNDALLARTMNLAMTILFQIPLTRKYITERNYLKNFIYNNRRTVLANRKIKKKLRYGLMMSYIGLDLENRIYRIFGKAANPR